MSKEKVALTVDKVALLIQDNKQLPEPEVISSFINKQTLCGDTLLITAIKHNPNAVIPLLKLNADPNQKNLAGKTPFHIMCDIKEAANYSYTHFNIFKYLLQSNIDINALDNQGKTVFESQYIRYYEPIVKEIMKHPNFNWKLKDKQTGDSILHPSFGVVVNKNAISMNKLGTVDLINKKQETPLHQYCGVSLEIEMVKLLISQKANPNLQTIEGETALSLLFFNNKCDRSGFRECFQKLIEAKADINQMVPQTKSNAYNIEKTSGVEPVFHRILRLANFDFIPMAIDAGAKLNKKDSNGKIAKQKFKSNEKIISILQASITNTNDKVSKLCQEINQKTKLANFNSYDIETLNGINRSGDTPLITAIRNNSILSIIPLLKAKADPNKRNSVGISPLRIMCDCKEATYAYTHVNILQSLLKHNADVNELDSNGSHILETSFGRFYEPIVKELLKQPNFNWNYQNPKTGNSFLHVNNMAPFGAIVVKLAMEMGPVKTIIDKQNKIGETGLHTQCEMGDKSTIELLIRNKADVNIRRNDGETPFSLFIFKHLSSMRSEYDNILSVFLNNNKTDVNLLVNLIIQIQVILQNYVL